MARLRARNMAGLGVGVGGGGYKDEGDEGDEGVLQAAVEVFAKLKVPRTQEATRGSGGRAAGWAGPTAEVGSATRAAPEFPAAACVQVSATWAALGLCACCLRGPCLLVRAGATRVLHLNLRCRNSAGPCRAHEENADTGRARALASGSSRGLGGDRQCPCYPVESA